MEEERVRLDRKEERARLDREASWLQEWEAHQENCQYDNIEIVL